VHCYCRKTSRRASALGPSFPPLPSLLPSSLPPSLPPSVRPSVRPFLSLDISLFPPPSLPPSPPSLSSCINRTQILGEKEPRKGGGRRSVSGRQQRTVGRPSAVLWSQRLSPAGWPTAALREAAARAVRCRGDSGAAITPAWVPLSPGLLRHPPPPGCRHHSNPRRSPGAERLRNVRQSVQVVGDCLLLLG
jgi:hypothetical protein